MNVAIVGSNFGLRGYLPAINEIKGLNIKIICSRNKNKFSPKKIENFEHEIINFYQICPKEMLDKLENPITNRQKNLAS